VAKATAAGGGAGRGRPPAATPARTDRASYVVEVYQELRKTTWPTPRELRRMTEVVIATVILFGLLIGGLDLLLSVIVKPLYTQIGSTPASTAQPTFTPVPAITATPAATAAAGATTSSVTATSSAGASPASSAAPGGSTGTGTVSHSSSST
jgi:preprotein translocase subunit SecE